MTWDISNREGVRHGRNERPTDCGIARKNGAENCKKWYNNSEWDRLITERKELHLASHFHQIGEH